LSAYYFVAPAEQSSQAVLGEINMHLKQEQRRPAIMLLNGAIWTGDHNQSYDALIREASDEIIFNREILLNSVRRGWINEKDEFVENK